MENKFQSSSNVHGMNCRTSTPAQRDSHVFNKAADGSITAVVSHFRYSVKHFHSAYAEKTWRTPMKPLALFLTRLWT